MSEANKDSDAAAAQCSFCGGTSFAPGELVEGGGQDAGGLPVVFICRECVDACAEAFATEQRVSADAWPVAENDESPAPIVAEWTEEVEITSQIRLPKPGK